VAPLAKSRAALEASCTGSDEPPVATAKAISGIIPNYFMNAPRLSSFAAAKVGLAEPSALQDE
jgi:hypothetical protein